MERNSSRPNSGQHRHFDRLLRQREKQVKSRALPYHTLRSNGSTSLLQYSMYHSQPKSSAFADSFGREERLKDVRLSFGIHAEAGVANAQLHIRAGGKTGCLSENSFEC